MAKTSTYNPGRGRPSKAYRYIMALSGGKRHIDKVVKQEVKKEVKKEMHSGRPESQTASLRVIGGKLRVKIAKSRSVKVGNKEFRV